VRDNFDEALEQVLKHEGGFSNHPEDPGGATMLGVTKRVWEAYIGRKVTVAQLRKLTSSDVAPLYKRDYWDKCNCDALPSGLDFAVFDYAVNSGVSRSCRALQTAAGVTPDGVIGPVTVAAATRQGKTLISDLCASRLRFLQSLPHWPTFGRGWSRRVADVRATALRMAGG